MSETAAAVTTETAAPVAAPAPVTEAAPVVAPAVETATETTATTATTKTDEPQQPTGPLDRRAARAQLHQNRQNAAKTADAVVAPEGAAPTAAIATTTTTDAPAATERGADGSPGPAAAVRPLRIEVPEGHPIREMGVTALDAVDPNQEQAVRALLNGTYTRRQENERLEREAREARTELIRLQAKQVAESKWKGTPAYEAAVEEFHTIKDTVGEAAASRFWQSFEKDREELEQQEFDARMGEIEQQEIDRAAEAWQAEAFEKTRVLPAPLRDIPEFPQWFNAAVVSFNTEIEAGHYPNITTKAQLDAEFEKYFAMRLNLQPKAVAVLAQLRQDRARAKQDAQAREAEDIARKARERAQAELDERNKAIADRRKAAPPHPMGGVAAIATPASAGAPEVPSTDGKSVSDIKRQARQASREIGRRHVPGL